MAPGRWILYVWERLYRYEIESSVTGDNQTNHMEMDPYWIGWNCQVLIIIMIII